MIETIFFFIVLIFSVIIHEISHGAVALRFGDSTAKYASRLTLNPLKHIDLFGSIILPLLLIISGSRVLFGWAKPVPINPLNFRNQRLGILFTGLAGPLANIAIALFFSLFIRYLPSYFPQSIAAMPFFSVIALLNLVLAIFNLVPIPPLDGSRVLFSLLPIAEEIKLNLERYGMLILILFLFFFMPFVSSLALFIFRFLAGTASFIF